MKYVGEAVLGAYVVGLLVGFIDDGATVGRNVVGILEGPDGRIVERIDGAIELGLLVGHLVRVVVGFLVGGFGELGALEGEADGTTEEGVRVGEVEGEVDGVIVGREVRMKVGLSVGRDEGS